MGWLDALKLPRQSFQLLRYEIIRRDLNDCELLLLLLLVALVNCWTQLKRHSFLDWCRIHGFGGKAGTLYLLERILTMIVDWISGLDEGPSLFMPTFAILYHLQPLSRSFNLNCII